MPEEGTPGGDGGEDEGEEGCTGYGCFLSGAREVITSSLGTPEEVRQAGIRSPFTVQGFRRGSRGVGDFSFYTYFVNNATRSGVRG